MEGGGIVGKNIIEYWVCGKCAFGGGRMCCGTVWRWRKGVWMITCCTGSSGVDSVA
jgi:hypothetical protein